MSSFFGSSPPVPPPPAPSSASSGNVTSLKQKLQEQLKQDLAIANAQELLDVMTKKCYKGCITKPSSKPMTRSDEGCLSSCMTRYMQAFDVISRSYQNRLLKEKAEPGLPEY
ncbi:putative mitochondrial import inner membrane translocase subunit tim13 [Hysterangium stoloniferum]|nr:putative mitochondrial import inner membrane translocase subunit tim13 [Hysterangium stoloniferum]